MTTLTKKLCSLLLLSINIWPSSQAIPFAKKSTLPTKNVPLDQHPTKTLTKINASLKYTNNPIITELIKLNSIDGIDAASKPMITSCFTSIESMIRQNPALLNAPSPAGTPLHVTFLIENPIIQSSAQALLLLLGADPLADGPHSQTPDQLQRTLENHELFRHPERNVFMPSGLGDQVPQKEQERKFIQSKIKYHPMFFPYVPKELYADQKPQETIAKQHSSQAPHDQELLHQELQKNKWPMLRWNITNYLQRPNVQQAIQDLKTKQSPDVFIAELCQNYVTKPFQPAFSIKHPARTFQQLQDLINIQASKNPTRTVGDELKIIEYIVENRYKKDFYGLLEDKAAIEAHRFYQNLRQAIT